MWHNWAFDRRNRPDSESKAELGIEEGRHGPAGDLLHMAPLNQLPQGERVSLAEGC